MTTNFSVWQKLSKKMNENINLIKTKKEKSNHQHFILVWVVQYYIYRQQNLSIISK